MGEIDDYKAGSAGATFNISNKADIQIQGNPIYDLRAHLCVGSF